MIRFYIILLLILLAPDVACADTAVPPLVNYQGVLTDDSGAPIPDGMKILEFNLYDAPLAANRVWGPQVFDNVPVVGGRLNVILGTTDSQGRSVADAFGSAERYLSFKAGNAAADLSGVAEISPRQRILSAPFALRALHGVPVGSIMSYFGSNAPDGWVLCDGRVLSDPSLQDVKYDALKAHLTGLGVGGDSRSSGARHGRSRRDGSGISE